MMRWWVSAGGVLELSIDRSFCRAASPRPHPLSLPLPCCTLRGGCAVAAGGMHNGTRSGGEQVASDRQTSPPPPPLQFFVLRTPIWRGGGEFAAIRPKCIRLYFCSRSNDGGALASGIAFPCDQQHARAHGLGARCAYGKCRNVEETRCFGIASQSADDRSPMADRLSDGQPCRGLYGLDPEHHERLRMDRRKPRVPLRSTPPPPPQIEDRRSKYWGGGEGGEVSEARHREQSCSPDPYANHVGSRFYKSRAHAHRLCPKKVLANRHTSKGPLRRAAPPSLYCECIVDRHIHVGTCHLPMNRRHVIQKKLPPLRQ